MLSETWMFAVNESFLVFYSEWFLCQLYQLAQGSMVSEGRGCGTLDVNRRGIGLWFLSWCVYWIKATYWQSVWCCFFFPPGDSGDYYYYFEMSFENPPPYAGPGAPVPGYPPANAPGYPPQGYPPQGYPAQPGPYPNYPAAPPGPYPGQPGYQGYPVPPQPGYGGPVYGEAPKNTGEPLLLHIGSVGNCFSCFDFWILVDRKVLINFLQ